jgi:ferritin-like metal-binding protein YciE
MKKSRSQSSGASSKKASSKSASKKSATPSRSTASHKKTASSTKASSNGRASSSRASSNGKSSSNGRATSSSRSRSKQSSPREGLQDVLKDLLKDIYYAEKQLVKALKKVSKASTHEQLKDAFDKHREQTEGQIEMLEQAFEAMEMRAAGKKCPAMDGLIEESNEHIQEMEKGAALDAALIVGAQKIEHYEIAAYGSMCTFAKSLGLTECEDIFNQILQQESDTDELLTQVAQTVNQDALKGEEMEMSEMEA